MNFPFQVKIALELLEKYGYEAYLVGGCVRDSILKKPQRDYDITTNAHPKEIMALFKDYKVVETGLKHGTVTVIIDSLPLEITTYRIDGDYLCNRKPENVVFCKSLREDLARRDFTMNTVCLGKNGIVDLFGGIKDIENKTIRAVGNAETRFEEDALRILRALRFASVLGFVIEEKTLSALYSKKELLKNISAERIADELMKTLSGEYADKVFARHIQIFGTVIPEILPCVNFHQHTKFHYYDVFTHSLMAMKNIANKPHLKLAALFHDIGKPSTFFLENGVGHFYGHGEAGIKIAKEILTRLKFDSFTLERVSILIKWHDAQIENNEKSVKKWLNKLTPEVFFELIELKRADSLALNTEFVVKRIEYIKSLEETAKRVIEEKQCFTLKDLCVKGTDLIALGFSGKEVGEKLHEVLNKVMDGGLQNNKEEIVKFLVKNK